MQLVGGYSVATDGNALDSTRALQRAIDAMSPWGTLYLPSGVLRVDYTVRMRPTIRLVGAGRARSSIVQANPSLSGVTVESGATDWVIEGVAIIGSRAAGATQGQNAGLSIYGGARGTVRDVRIENFAGIGLQAGGIVDSVFEDIDIANVGLHGLWLGWNGVNASAGYARRNRVRRVCITGVDVDGLEVHAETIFEDVTLRATGLRYTAADGIGKAGGFYVLPASDRAGYDISGTRMKSDSAAGSGFDIGTGCERVILRDASASNNGASGFSLAGRDCYLGNFRAYGNGANPQTPLRAGVLIGSPGGSAACNRNTVTDGIVDYNICGLLMADRSIFAAYGDLPTLNRVRGLTMFGNGNPYINPVPSAPNFINLNG